MPREVRRAVRWGALLAVVVFAILASGGSRDGLTARGPFSSAFFDAQAEALLDGHLHVPPEAAGLEGFVHDGKTYFYFGLVPSLVRLPIAAVSDGFDGRLTVLAMLVALAVALTSAGRIAWRARVRVLGDAPLRRWEPAVLGAFAAAVGLSSPLLFLGARPLVYHEVEMWGAATTLLTVEAILAWWDQPSGRRLAVASLAAAIALNTRASVGGGALAGLALVLALAWLWRHVPRRTLPWLALAVLLPAASYAAVNAGRFGTAVSVPFEDQVQSGFDPPRQAALEATDGTLFGPEYAPTALATYLRPDGVRWQALFPWITFREPGEITDPQFDTVERAASLPVVAPVLLVLAVAGAVALLRPPRPDPWLPVVVGTALGLASTLTIAIIANRYLADFVPPLVVLAAVGVWPITGWIAARRGWPRRAAVGGLVALAAMGTIVGVALGLQAQRLLILPDREARYDFVSFQYDLDDRLGGGTPPAVRQTDDVDALEADRGDVAIQDDCAGLFWHDGDRWWPLELAEGRQVELTGDISSTAPIATGPGWSIEPDVRDDDVRFAFVRDGERLAEGRWHPRSSIDDRPLTVRVDEVNGEAFVEVDGRPLLVAWYVRADGPIEAGPGWDAHPSDAPLCEELLGRLDGS